VRVNATLRELGPYASKTIARQVEGDADIVSLSIGEPVFGPPPEAAPLLEELGRSGGSRIDGLKRYETSRGAPSLRQAIARYYSHYFDLSTDPERELLITHGGAGALTGVILATTNSGDGVLIGDPSYMLYERLVLVLGRVPRRVPRSAAEGYRFDLDRIEGLVTPSTSALIVNSPENPTGYVCSDEEMAGLARLCQRNGMTLIHDEVYDQFSFSRTHRSAAHLAGFDSVVLVNSLSKKFGVPGLRVGWVAAAAPVVDLIAKAQDYTMLAMGAFPQGMAEALLTCPGLDAWFADVRATLSTRIATAERRLAATPGIELPFTVAGGMFVFPSVAQLAARLGLPGGAPAGDAVAAWLLSDARVAVVPGSVYGAEGNQSIRLVLCGREGDVEEALLRIERSMAETLKCAHQQVTRVRAASTR
jgi:aminotransferase